MTIKKRQKRLQVFDLQKNTEADAYYKLLTKIAKQDIKVPIMAKGTMRMVDMSKQLKKADFYPPFEAYWTQKERQLIPALSTQTHF